MYPELKGKGHFIAEGTRLIGNVKLESECSIWFNSVLRADNDCIHIGEGSNIQDGSIIHTDVGFPVHVGAYTTIGHRCILHGCSIGNHTLIGMGSTIMNGAIIGNHCLVAAGSLILENFTEAESGGFLIMGSPAKIKRKLNEEEQVHLKKSAESYIQKAYEYSRGNI